MSLDILSAYAQKSRAIVIFNNNKALVYGDNDGLSVMAWARSWSEAPSEAGKRTLAENGGLFHVVVYTVNTGFVTYETEH